MMRYLKHQFPILLVTIQLLIIGFFGGFTEYSHEIIPTGGNEGPGLRYTYFQDVHVMMYIGFGFLLVYLGNHGYSSISYNFMIGAVCFQWALLTNGFFFKCGPRVEDGFCHFDKIGLNVEGLIDGDYAVASVLICFSAVLGKFSASQYLIMGFIQVMFYSLNFWIGKALLGASDVGGSMWIHVFGCYFGLSCAWARRTNSALNHGNNKATYTSDMYSMIGTLFLWMFWPSFNGALAVEGAQHIVVINTLISLSCSCTATFVFSKLLKGKFEMVHLQNSSLAGGVAIGAVSDFLIQPFAAGIIGFVAGSISVIGFTYLTPYLERKIKLHDSAGINNLHGMPGIIGGLAAVFSTLRATPEEYGYHELYTRFPYVAPSNITLAAAIGVEAGFDRTLYQQAGFQAASIFVSIVIAIIGGLFTGFILGLPFIEKLEAKHYFSDFKSFHLPDHMKLSSDGNVELKSTSINMPMSSQPLNSSTPTYLPSTGSMPQAFSAVDLKSLEAQEASQSSAQEVSSSSSSTSGSSSSKSSSSEEV